MIEPFDRPSNEGSPTADEVCGRDARKCKFCATLHRARELELFDPWPELCSPLTPGVQLVNLSYSDDGQILHVHLGRHWKRMFEQLPLIGEGLVMTRNEAAILGRRMIFPELAFTTRATKGASGQGGLWFDFRALGAARAVHLRCESGHIFGIEFADAAGATIHLFTATKASNLDNFLGWVRLHQECSGRGSAAGEPGSLSDGPPAAAVRWCVSTPLRRLLRTPAEDTSDRPHQRRRPTRLLYSAIAPGRGRLVVRV